MKDVYSRFEGNARRVREMVAIFQALSRQTTGVLDLTDILRAAVVALVSAFDYFIHEIVRVGILETASGTRVPSGKYSSFKISMATAVSFQGAINLSALEHEVRSQHGWLSFQEPDKVADAIRLVSDVKLWEVVGGRMGHTPQGVKGMLKLIVDRRNKIAHESDMDPTAPGVRWPIDCVWVLDTIEFVEKLVEAIFIEVG